MLFNSFEFIFLYVPFVFAGYLILARTHLLWSAAWLLLASYFFYGWWNPKYLILLVISIAVNYEIGIRILRRIANGSVAAAKKYLIAGIAFNLALLGYFKYASFVLQNFNHLFSHNSVIAVTLPLGISFFTFTQIAFLADAYRGRITKKPGRIHYSLFVTYFPHLIAGPILHHNEMIPQFERKATYLFRYENIAVGATIFFIGLFKKVILADGIAVHVDRIFDAATLNSKITLLEAWSGAVSYGLQLYFDFSGYSDMAIGVSRMFGISLPINFFSPYKSSSIIEFWQRWHMTLSRFLRDYLYIPLGGNQKGSTRRYANLFVTMLLGGLWHGAGWTFVVWGGLHGTYLIVNHSWRSLQKYIGRDLRRQRKGLLTNAAAALLTFIAVTFAWVFFRAKDMSAALVMISGMLGDNGTGLSESFLAEFGAVGGWLWAHGIGTTSAADNHLVSAATILWIGALMVLVWFAPNTQQIMSRYEPLLNGPDNVRLSSRIIWTPSIGAAVVICAIALVAIANLSTRSVFLYFQF